MIVWSHVVRLCDIGDPPQRSLPLPAAGDISLGIPHEVFRTSPTDAYLTPHLPFVSSRIVCLFHIKINNLRHIN